MPVKKQKETIVRIKVEEKFAYMLTPEALRVALEQLNRWITFDVTVIAKPIMKGNKKDKLVELINAYTIVREPEQFAQAIREHFKEHEE